MDAKRKSFFTYLKERIKGNPIIFAFICAYLLVCYGSIIYFIVIGKYRDCGICFIYSLVVPIYYIVEWALRIKIPIAYIILFIIFMLGNFLGACFNFYTLIPFLDDIQHGLWGVVFAVLGFAVIKALLGEPQNNRSFMTYLLFSVAFAIMIGVVWEIYEFTVDHVSTDYDMQEDTIVNNIYSFFLYPEYDHLHTEKIEGIAYTILYDAAGNEIYRIEGGYLDLGIIDTMFDIIWCTVSAVGISALLVLDRYCFKGAVYKYLVPALEGRSAEPEERVPEKNIDNVFDDDEEPVAQTHDGNN